MSDDLMVKDIHSRDQSYGRWVVWGVHGCKGEAAAKTKPGVWISTEDDSAHVYLSLSLSREELIEIHLELADLAERGLFDGILEQLPDRGRDNANF